MKRIVFLALLIACAMPALAAHKKHINCRRVPALAYQWPENDVLQYAQTHYRLTSTQLRVLKFCIEHRR